jgi:CubicO group peptidase (beta-lactamase class C family)
MITAERIDTVRPEDVGFSSVRLQRIDATMRRLVNEEKIAGGVTLVARQGKVAHFEATGLMDIEARRPMERDAIFRIASMTKPITVTAVMMLFEEGHFLLDDPISDFIPEFAHTRVFVQKTEQGGELADLERPITIRHLLMHTSGLTHPMNPDDAVSRMYAEAQIRRPDEKLAEKVRRLAALPLAHRPGARWTYGWSHDVLGRLIEVISGQPFDRFLRQRIFDPLEMTDTGFDLPSQQLDRLAAVHTALPAGGILRADRPDLDRSEPRVFFSGGGGLLSTATDYARFCQMLLDGGVLGNAQLLSRKTVELMTANHWTGDGSPFPPGFPMPDGSGFGLGMRTVIDVAQSGLPGSAGEYSWSGLYSTSFWIDPVEQVIGLLMVQLEPMNLRYARIFQVLAYSALVA